MTTKSVWQKHDVLGKVLDILRGVRNPRDPELQGGHPFLSAYQLAILLDERHPEIRQEIDMPICGRLGRGGRDSLAHYLSFQLSKSHRDERIDHIEKAVLSGTRCKISFNSNDGVFESTGNLLTMFRYRP